MGGLFCASGAVAKVSVAGLMSIFDRVFYYPDHHQRGTPTEYSLPYEDVFFPTEDGAAWHGWFLPSADGRPAHATVLHLHGNAANISGHYEFIRWLPGAGYHVLTFDYRGYGRSAGRVSRRRTLSDAAAALDYLRTRPDVRSDRIVVFGQSIGGAVAVLLAARRRDQIRAVAVDSAFSGYRKIVRYHVSRKWWLTALAWWLPCCVSTEHDPIDFVGRVSPVPLLFMHGKADRIVPWEMSEELHAAAKEPKDLWLVEGMDHTETWEAAPEAAQRSLLGFYERALAADPV